LSLKLASSLVATREVANWNWNFEEVQVLSKKVPFEERVVHLPKGFQVESLTREMHWM
jgi:hypothetical protein